MLLNTFPPHPICYHKQQQKSFVNLVHQWNQERTKGKKKKGKKKKATLQTSHGGSWKLQHHSAEWAVGGTAFDESRTFCSQLNDCSLAAGKNGSSTTLGRQAGGHHLEPFWFEADAGGWGRGEESKVSQKGCRRWCSQRWVGLSGSARFSLPQSMP